MEWNCAACGRKCYHLLNIRQVLIGICLGLFKFHDRWTRNEMMCAVIILMIINKDILNTWTDANLTLPFANTCFILHPHGRFLLKPMFSKIQDYLANNCLDDVCKRNKVNLFLWDYFRVEWMFSDHLCIVHHNIEGKDEDRFEHA